MYLEVNKSATKVLIIRTSALGDIVQTFHVLDYLHARFEHVVVDWAVDASLASLVAAHPLVRRAIPLSIKERSFGKLIREVRALREEKYDLVFDLQKNTKSGFVTFLSRSNEKVGFGLATVREWPNVLATNRRFNVPNMNTRLQYVRLLQKYFKDDSEPKVMPVRFKIDEAGKKKLEEILVGTSTPRIMVCPGSKWINKQLPTETLIEVLQGLQGTFFLMWGDAVEREMCEQIAEAVSGCVIVDKLPLPVWQNLMNDMQLVIAVDSSALHLCGTSSAPSFSLFGPTSPEIFKPLGKAHQALQGECPYGVSFEKQCPKLRTCPTGACIRNLPAHSVKASLNAFLGTQFGSLEKAIRNQSADLPFH